MLGCASRLPSARVEGVSLTDLGLSQASAEVAVAVDNPLLVDVPLEGWRWELSVADHAVGRGAGAAPLVLAANGVTTVPIPVEVVYAELAAAAGQAGSEVPYEVRVELDVATPRGAVTLPLAHQGTLPRLEAPTLDVVAVRPGLDGARLTLEVELAVGLPPGLAIEALAFSASVGGAVIGEGAVLPGEDGRLVLPLAVDASQAAAASWAAAWGQAGAVSLTLDGRVATPLGSVPVRWERVVSSKED